MVVSNRIIAAAKTGQSLFDTEEERAEHRADLIIGLDRTRSADPAYRLPHNVLWLKFLGVEHVAKWARLKADFPEWTESRRDWELSPHSPDKLISVGKDKDGNDMMVCESQARGRWSPYPGMSYD